MLGMPGGISPYVRGTQLVADKYIASKLGFAPGFIEKLAAEKAAAKDKLWKANGAYTTLVFHSSSSREPAAKLTQALLNAGFTASDTETDFGELQKVQPKEGTAYITYNQAGAQVLDDIRAKVQAMGLVKEVNVNPRAISLKRGDVQVLVF